MTPTGHAADSDRCHAELREFRGPVSLSGGDAVSRWLRLPQVERHGDDVSVGVQEEVHGEPRKA